MAAILACGPDAALSHCSAAALWQLTPPRAEPAHVYHRTPAQQAADRIRDQAHAAAGLTSLRFTRAQVRIERNLVQATLTAVGERMRRL